MSYAIGVAQPTSISLNTFGTGKLSDDKIIKLVRDNFDLRPYAITTMLDLLHPMYQATAAYGHFGRTPVEMTVGDDTFTAFTWEKPTAPTPCAQLPACKTQKKAPDDWSFRGFFSSGDMDGPSPIKKMRRAADL